MDDHLRTLWSKKIKVTSFSKTLENSKISRHIFLESLSRVNIMITTPNRAVIFHDCDDEDSSLITLYERITEHYKEVVKLSLGTPQSCNGLQSYNWEDLAEKIDRADICVVLVSEDTKSCSIFERAISYANEKENLIVGVWQLRAPQCKLPVALENYGESLVTLQEDDFVSAIKGNSRYWKNTDGNNRPARSIKHHDC